MVEGIAVVDERQAAHIPGIAVVMAENLKPGHGNCSFVGCAVGDLVADSFVDDPVADNVADDYFVAVGSLVVRTAVAGLAGLEVVPIFDLQLQLQLRFSCEARLA